MSLQGVECPRQSRGGGPLLSQAKTTPLCCQVSDRKNYPALGLQHAIFNQCV